LFIPLQYNNQAFFFNTAKYVLPAIQNRDDLKFVLAEVHS